MPPESSESQQRALLTRRLTIALVTPVVLLFALGAVLGRQVLLLAENASWVDHTDQVISTAYQTQLQIIDQETGIRGYFLTGDRVFLEPFERARPREGFDQLRDLSADNPAQQSRFAEARRRYEGWLAGVEPALEGVLPAELKSNESMRTRKVRMDSIREVMRQAIVAEEGLRHERVLASNRSVESTRLSFLVLLTAAAGLLAFLSRRQLSAIAETFGAALDAESRARVATESEAWIRAAHARFLESLQGEKTIEQLGTSGLGSLAESTGAAVGAFFLKEGVEWRRRAGHAIDSRAAGPETFLQGEGIVGTAGAQNKLVHLRDLPGDFLRLRTGTGESVPAEAVVVPASVEGVSNAVIELGFLGPVPPRALDLLGRVGEGLALAVRSSEYKQQLRELLEESQRQAEELQTQQEELRVANEELEVQTTAQRSTQRQLEQQQAELEQTNDHLVQQQQLLERQNRVLAESQAELARKAREVERASQYKSEFLSNMSHELRTPLNSSLILAKLLADNRDGNLNDEQVKFASTIYAAGNDLLALINDILDLAKIESGKMDVHATRVTLDRVSATLRRTFEPVASQKGLRFAVDIDRSTPASIETDAQRLEQILKNLVSNALKFTSEGEVVVSVATRNDRVSFAVHDTGIGIPSSQQQIIFEAFRQADGTTNRKYGGTGLGLSISRELARLLGGDVAVTSEAGQGSTFTLTIPTRYVGPLPAAPTAAVPPAEAPPTEVLLTRTPTAPPVAMLGPSGPSPAPAAASRPATVESPEPPGSSSRTLLIVEDDEVFARVLVDVAREAGFEGLVATSAATGFTLAKQHMPTGIVLDMGLPDHSGLSVLDRLKRDPVTRHIPVHIVSGSDQKEAALSMGAAAYLLKPVERERLVEALESLEARSSRRLRHVLVVEDDAVLRQSVASLLGRDDVEITTVGSAREALEKLRERTFDCIVTDLGLPDQSGYELLETMASEEPYSVPPVIVYTGRALTADEEQRLRKYSRSIIVKGARSPERLLDEVTLFLHQVESELPPEQQKLLKQARHREALFEGRTILVVEDDVRNVFALTSVLEPKGARVAIARNGREALTALQKEPRVDLVLMDLMMPEMDGLEATREIRKEPRWARLPIIALTAKAMKDDQEKCLAAGANDYLAKPLDVEMLLSLLRVWMPRT